MNQKKSLPAAIALFVLMITSTSAFADPFVDFYTVAGDGSTVAKTVFGWDEKPWVYTNFGDPSVLQDIQLWSHGALVLSTTIPTGPIVLSSPLNNQIWFSYSDAFWNSVKAKGDWNIQSYAFSFNGTTFRTLEGDTSFHINAAPEPSSMWLFFAGAALFSMVLVTRRKQLIAA